MQPTSYNIRELNVNEHVQYGNYVNSYHDAKNAIYFADQLKVKNKRSYVVIRDNLCEVYRSVWEA